jgi:osmotically-inducible protein OsmY
MSYSLHKLLLKGEKMISLDEQIKLSVIDQLKWDSRVDISDIDVAVSGRTVKLKGSVPSHRMREIATMDVLDVDGVTYLANELKVKFSQTAVLPDDEQIKGNIEKMFSWDPEIEPENIAVTVSAGKVTLEGSVNAIWKKLKSQDIASNVTGVFQIINKLVVVPTDTYVDQNISETIMAALERNAHVNARDINITVENQMVTLSGKVPGWKVYRAAQDAALYTRGVVQVHNNLVVG